MYFDFGELLPVSVHSLRYLLLMFHYPKKLYVLGNNTKIYGKTFIWQDIIFSALQCS